MLAIDTDDRQACELVAGAIGAIDAYKANRTRDLLESALSDLGMARHRDRGYLLAPYYSAVVEDLLGRSGDAAVHLQAVLAETPRDRLEFFNEVRFNLAVAQFHRYSHPYLKEAEQTLTAILEDTRGISRRVRHYRVRLHAKALLARVYAMWSIPPNAVDGTKPEERRRILSCYESSIRNARSVLSSLSLFVLRLRDSETAREVEAITRTAIGAANMYYTDFFLEPAQKIKLLRSGLKQLQASDRLFPRDWATYCNIGSCHMRLAFWGQTTSEYSAARKPLIEVIQNLNPNYGFALYEIGRSYRIEGQFKEAIKYLQSAKEVPVSNRAVSDRRIDRELALAQANSREYP